MQNDENTMLVEIKKIQGINHNDFDNMINTWISSAQLDLKSVGIVNALVDEPDSLVQTAIITYVLSFIDIPNADMYAKSYSLQKDVLRHLKEYTWGEYPYAEEEEQNGI